MIRILQTADIHLDASLPWLGEKEVLRREDFLNTFERLLNLAIKNEVHLFIVAGGLFDNPRPAQDTLDKVQAGLKRLMDRGIVPVLVPGIRDQLLCLDPHDRPVEFPGSIVLPCAETGGEPVCVTVQGYQVFLYGLAGTDFSVGRAAPGMKRRSAEGIHLGVLRRALPGPAAGDGRENGGDPVLPVLKSWGLDYVALGHQHHFAVLEEDGRVYGCCSGSPEGKWFGENGPRHCGMVRVEKGCAMVEKIQVNSRILEERNLDFSGCEDQQLALKEICGQGNSDLLLRLNLVGTVEAPLDSAGMLSSCADQFFHLEINDHTRQLDSVFARRVEKEETVRGIFVRRARELRAKAAEGEDQAIEEAFRLVLERLRSIGREVS